MESISIEKTKNVRIKWIVQIATSIVVGMAISAMIMSGSFNLKCFYDVGKVTDVYGMVLTQGDSGIDYVNSDEKYLTVLTDYASKMLPGSSHRWAEVDIQVTHLKSTETEWTIVGYDKDGNSVFSRVEQIGLGHNRIKTDGMAFQSVKILVRNQKGNEFILKSVQFRADEHSINFVAFFVFAAIFAVVYNLIFVLLRKKGIEKKICDKIDVLINGYQKILAVIYNKAGKICNFNERTKRFGRIFCFSFVILYMVFMWNVGKYVSWYKQTSLIMSVCIFLIFLFSVEDGMKVRKWDKNFFRSWFLFMVWLCISDFIVSKTYCFTGYIFLLFMGLMLYAWSHMKNPEVILRDIVYAVQITFFILTIYCMFCRPLKEGYRYNGPFFASNVFANYLILVAACELSIMVNLIQGEWKWKKAVLLSIEQGITLFFLWKAQARGPILTVGILAVLISYYLLIRKRKIKQFVLTLVIMAICILPSWMMTEKVLNIVPGAFGTVIDYETDLDIVQDSESNINGKIVYASESRVFNTIKRKNLDGFSSGRVTIWKEYLRGMNLLGHSGNAKVGDKRQVAHNLFLEMLYRYGILVFPFYLSVWLFSFRKAMNYMRKDKSYSCLPISISLSFFVLALNDTLERPWVLGLWFFAYFLMLFYMFEREDGILLNRLSEEDGEVQNG